MSVKRLLYGSLVVFVFLYGVAVGRFRIFPYQAFQEAKHSMNVIASTIPAISVDTGYSDVFEKQEIPCSAIDMTNTMVALTFGQSNSANSGETRYSPSKSVYNFYEGKCYQATDPLLGATGDKGSVWTRLGDMLINHGLYGNVVFVSIGVNGSAVSRWNPDGDLFQRIVDIKSQLDEQNIELTHLLWHQGETDGGNGTNKDDYKTMLTDMVDGIRHLGVNAPLYLAIATRCGGPIKIGIHEAQLELVQEREDILMGANTDTISDMDDRYDSCHFSEAGLQKHARLWLQSIRDGNS
jgi:hypothetical protein